MLQGNNSTQHYHTITYNIMQYYTCTAQTKNKQMQQLKNHNFHTSERNRIIFWRGKGAKTLLLCGHFVICTYETFLSKVCLLNSASGPKYMCQQLNYYLGGSGSRRVDTKKMESTTVRRLEEGRPSTTKSYF